MLTESAEAIDKILGLAVGADDALNVRKPFEHISPTIVFHHVFFLLSKTVYLRYNTNLVTMANIEMVLDDIGYTVAK
jgi:hypothetical protein